MPKPRWITVARTAAIATAAGAVLGACGSRQSPVGPGIARHPPSLPTPVARGPTPATDMVAAVGDGKPGVARVSVRFELRARPQVAQPLDVDLAILPSAGLDRVYGKVEADDGLELVSGAQIAPAERPTENVPISHTLRVVPEREGVLALRAVVSADSGGQASSQTFSIPLIVGAAAATPASTTR